jgi:glucose-1-phosphate thymidylyltransferase
LFDILSQLIKKEKKDQEEIHLTDALMLMIKKGVEFESFRADNWYDCGKVEILLETNAKLLKNPDQVTSDPDAYSSSVIILPVNIASDTVINNSIVGPNVTIGKNVEINASIISNSIIGDFAKLDQVILKDSVIGSDTTITGLCQTLNIGDNTDIDFSTKF